MAENGHIFISYSEKDSEIALKVANRLEEKGYDTWYFRRDSFKYANEKWRRLIVEAIKKCSAFILFVSPDSLVSDMVDIEVNLAMDKFPSVKEIFPLFYHITKDEAEKEKIEWALLFTGRNIIEITLSNIEPKLFDIIGWLERIGIKPSIISKQVDETKPEEKKVEPEEETATKKSDTELDKNTIAKKQETETAESAKTENQAAPSTITANLKVDTEKTDLPQKIIGKDGAPMVLIPAGEFEMGDNDFENAKVHEINLDAFYIDVHEVTNEQYKKFMEATGHKAPAFWNDERFNKPDHPVVGVSWHDAKAYADWAKKRLPTEAEWEKAARGGSKGEKYVWGDIWPPPKGAGNFADESSRKYYKNWSIISGYDDGYAHTSPVGSFDANKYELYDMAGNVWEWCADWYDPDYYKVSEKENPKGPDKESGVRVLRGGSWHNNLTYYLRVAYRFSGLFPMDYNGNVGFRCVSGLPD